MSDMKCESVLELRTQMHKQEREGLSGELVNE